MEPILLYVISYMIFFLVLFVIVYFFPLGDSCPNCFTRIKEKSEFCPICKVKLRKLVYIDPYQRSNYYSFFYRISLFVPTLKQLNVNQSDKEIEEELIEALQKLKEKDKKMYSGFKGYINKRRYGFMRNFLVNVERDLTTVEDGSSTIEENKVVCNSCSEENFVDSKFCENCGVKL